LGIAALLIVLITASAVASKPKKMAKSDLPPAA
jgi:hypothetical protein